MTGLIKQYVLVSAPSTYNTYTFPVPFKNTDIYIFMTYEGNISGTIPRVEQKTTTNFVFDTHQNSTTKYPFRYMAIGY